MKIGNPEDLKNIDGFHQAFNARCQADNLNFQKFIGPDDKFQFSCQRTNVCCKNFTDGERIILEPYDVYRLSRSRKISTSAFLERYSELTIDSETHLPIALLTYKGEERRNKCHFLRSFGCGVYKDRPLRCRLYPLGRINNNNQSYFMLINNCPCGDSPCGKEWSVQSWVDDSEAEDYLDNQNILHSIYYMINKDAYRLLPLETKTLFGRGLYDIDSFLRRLPAEDRPESDIEIMGKLKNWAEDFIANNGCLLPEYDRGRRKLTMAGRKDEHSGSLENSPEAKRKIPENVTVAD